MAEDEWDVCWDKLPIDRHVPLYHSFISKGKITRKKSPNFCKPRKFCVITAGRFKQFLPKHYVITKITINISTSKEGYWICNTTIICCLLHDYTCSNIIGNTSTFCIHNLIFSAHSYKYLQYFIEASSSSPFEN